MNQGHCNVKSARYVIFCAALLFACTAPEVAEPEHVRGPLGKADHVAGSCAEASSCGTKSPGSCWCDDLCVNYNDCCSDAAAICGVDVCNPETGSGCHAGEVCVDGPPAECQRCPDPQDPAVHYVSEDPAVCAVVRFTCEPGQEAFTDQCGCGCIDVGGPSSCTGNDDCTEAEFCSQASCGEGGEPGQCVTRPEVCIQVYDPVCGCDGRTYGNACTAASHGINIVGPGECPPQPDSCRDRCGGPSEDASCWCDTWCAYYGDCCDDKLDYCG
jgi:hypothetical protein